MGIALENGARSREVKVLKEKLLRLSKGVAAREQWLERALAPLSWLELLAAEAPRALAHDALAAERFRALLASTGDLGRASGPADDEDPPRRIQVEPGLVSPGAAVHLMLTAIRCGTSASLGSTTAPAVSRGDELLKRVHGLLVALSPLEVLLDLAPGSFDDQSAGRLLDLLAMEPLGNARGQEFGVSFMPAERARRSALHRLADRVRSRYAKETRWDAADAARIERTLRDGETLSVELSRAANPRNAARTLVLARAGAPTVELVHETPSAQLVTARLPPEVGAGAWVGWTTLDSRERARELREALRTEAPELLHEIYPDAPFPVDAIIVDGSDVVPQPPRSLGNRVPAPARVGTQPVQPEPSDDLDVPNVSPRPRIVVVLLTPAVLFPGGDTVPQRVPATAVRERLAGLADVREPAWVEDSLAAMLGAPVGPEDARVERVLEGLAIAAARSPGHEHAVWLAVLPDLPHPSTSGAPSANDRGWFVSRLAEAALRVVVATASSVLDALTADELDGAALRRATKLGPTTERLRITGVLDAKDDVTLESVREELRPGGRGAPLMSALRFVAFDEEGREVLSEPVRVHRTGRPARFAALLPVTPEVLRVEIRRKKNVVLTLERPDGRPVLDDVRVEPDGNALQFSWRWRHEALARVSFEVEVERDGVWTPVAQLGACGSALRLDLARFNKPHAVRVVALDGWQAAVSAPIGTEWDAQEAPVVLRRLGGRRFWVDGPAANTAGAEWHMAERDDTTGVLALVARGASGTLSVRLADGRELRRAMEPLHASR